MRKTRLDVSANGEVSVNEVSWVLFSCQIYQNNAAAFSYEETRKLEFFFSIFNHLVNSFLIPKICLTYEYDERKLLMESNLISLLAKNERIQMNLDQWCHINDRNKYGDLH